MRLKDRARDVWRRGKGKETKTITTSFIGWRKGEKEFPGSCCCCGNTAAVTMLLPLHWCYYSNYVVTTAMTFLFLLLLLLLAVAVSVTAIKKVFLLLLLLVVSAAVTVSMTKSLAAGAGTLASSVDMAATEPPEVTGPVPVTVNPAGDAALTTTILFLLPCWSYLKSNYYYYFCGGN